MARLALSLLALAATANAFSALSEQEALGKKMLDNFIALQADVANRDESTPEKRAAAMNHVLETYMSPDIIFHMWEYNDQQMFTWKGREGVRTIFSQVWDLLRGGGPTLEALEVTIETLDIIFVYNRESVGTIAEAVSFTRYDANGEHIVHLFEHFLGGPEGDIVEDYSCCLVGP